jgi:hypothetical protein
MAQELICTSILYRELNVYASVIIINYLFKIISDFPGRFTMLSGVQTDDSHFEAKESARP